MRKRAGAVVQMHFRVADAVGIAVVRIVSQSRAVKVIEAKGAPLVDGTFSCKVAARPRYYRLESVAGDGRRAFSTPIYVELGNA